MNGNASERTAVGERVLAALDKFPTMPTRRLARLLVAQHPAVFASEHHACSAIQYYRGKMGAAARKELAEKRHVTDNVLGLPEPEPNSWAPYEFPAGEAVVALAADLHVPYHDMRAVEAFIRAARAARATHVLLDGDTMDCYALSKFDRDPERRPFKDEVRDTIALLLTIQEETGAEVIFKEGNHEFRLTRYLRAHAPELLGVNAFRLSEILGLAKLGIVSVDALTPILVGALGIVHGTEFASRAASTVNPARGVFLKSQECTIVAHHHRASEHTERRAFHGEMVTCWSVGCLCDLHPEYAPINNWTHGFAIIRVDKGGGFHVENRRMHRGKVY